MTRLFVAVWPTAPALDHVRSLPHDGWVNVRWLPEDNWHVTLAFRGEADIADVTQRLQDGEYPRSTAELEARMRVMGRSNLVVPVQGLDALASAVRARVFDEPSRQPFLGHLTVARSIGRRPISGRSPTGHAPEPHAFEVEEIALVRSTLSPQGARYETVATFECW